MERFRKPVKVRGNQNCSVPHCHSVRYKCPHLSFHQFPKDKYLCKIWRIKAKIEKKIGSSASVCSLHFKLEDFHPQTNLTIRPHLKKGAVPSQNLPIRKLDCAGLESDSRKERMERRLHPAASDKSMAETASAWSGDGSDVIDFGTVKVKREPPDDPETAATAVSAGQHETGSIEADHGGYCHQAEDVSPEDQQTPWTIVHVEGDSAMPSASSMREHESEAERPVTVPPPRELREGEMPRHLTTMLEKQRLVDQLEDKYNSLLYMVEYRSSHPEWEGRVPPPEPLLLTLRSDKIVRFPHLPAVNTLSQDIVLPLTPTDAWRALTSLREQLLDLHVKLMQTRIMVLNSELRLQETQLLNTSFRKRMRRDNRVRKVVRIQHGLSTKLMQIFTPAQMSRIRTGGKAHWREEDLRRAIELRTRLNRRDYEFVRKRLRIPMPNSKFIRRSAKRFPSLKPLCRQMVGDHGQVQADDSEEEDTPSRLDNKTVDESLEVRKSASSPAAKRPRTARMRRDRSKKSQKTPSARQRSQSPSPPPPLRSQPSLSRDHQPQAPEDSEGSDTLPTPLRSATSVEAARQGMRTIVVPSEQPTLHSGASLSLDHRQRWAPGDSGGSVTSLRAATRAGAAQRAMTTIVVPRALRTGPSWKLIGRPVGPPCSASIAPR